MCWEMCFLIVLVWTGEAEKMVIEWWSVWDDRGAIGVRDGDKYWETEDIKRKERNEPVEAEEMGGVEDVYLMRGNGWEWQKRRD